MEYDLYEVSFLEDIKGNEHQIGKLRAFANEINKGVRRMPLLVFGPSGIGKSAAVNLLAKENNWNVVELNASDYRDKETIESRLISAATSKPLFSKKNLILLDEIDELAAGFDKGSGTAISALINESKNPIIFIANDMWDQSISFLRGKVEPLEFKKIFPDTIQAILLRLCARFSIEVNREALDMMANRANGDARSAINDLSVLIGSKDTEIIEVLGLRDRKIDIFNTLDKVFLTTNLSNSMRVMTSTDLTNDMLIKWIDENIPRRYKYSEEMYSAFDSLAMATMFGARAQRAQYYIYWRYMNVLASGGVSLAKSHYPEIRTPYAFPKVIKELSGSKLTRNQDKIIAAKLQRVFHSSIKRIIKNEMPLLSSTMAKAIKENADVENKIREDLAAIYQLDDKEMDYLLGMNN